MVTPPVSSICPDGCPHPHICAVLRVWGTSAWNWGSTGLGARCFLSFRPGVPLQRFLSWQVQTRVGKRPWTTGSAHHGEDGLGIPLGPQVWRWGSVRHLLSFSPVRILLHCW